MEGIHQDTMSAVSNDFGAEREDFKHHDPHLEESVCKKDPSSNLDLDYDAPESEDPNSDKTPEEVPDEINININISDSDDRPEAESDTSSIDYPQTLDSEMNEDEPEQYFYITEIVSAPTQALEYPPTPTEDGKFSTFHPFSFLPAEIRRHIWIDALPGPRIIHILYNVLWDNFRYIDMSFGGRWQLDSPYSIGILSACQESRSEAITDGYELIRLRRNEACKTWINFQIDTMFWNTNIDLKSDYWDIQDTETKELYGKYIDAHSDMLLGPHRIPVTDKVAAKITRLAMSAEFWVEPQYPFQLQDHDACSSCGHGRWDTDYPYNSSKSHFFRRLKNLNLLQIVQGAIEARGEIELRCSDPKNSEAFEKQALEREEIREDFEVYGCQVDIGFLELEASGSKPKRSSMDGSEKRGTNLVLEEHYHYFRKMGEPEEGECRFTHLLEKIGQLNFDPGESYRKFYEKGEAVETEDGSITFLPRTQDD